MYVILKWFNCRLVPFHVIDIDSLDESFLRNISNIYETSTGFKIEMEVFPATIYMYIQ